jgi:radial spoke head protein 9
LKISFKVLLKEEDRLSAVLSKVEEEAHVVPRGSFVQQPTGEIVKNRLFEGDFKFDLMLLISHLVLLKTNYQGLSINESAKFGNYFHFREATLLAEKSPLFKANLDKAIDFLDPIDEDQPKGNCFTRYFRSLF